MKLKDDIIERLGITKYAKYLNLYISISDCDLKLERERKIIKILKKIVSIFFYITKRAQNEFSLFFRCNTN